MEVTEKKESVNLEINQWNYSNVKAERKKREKK